MGGAEIADEHERAVVERFVSDACVDGVIDVAARDRLLARAAAATVVGAAVPAAAAPAPPPPRAADRTWPGWQTPAAPPPPPRPARAPAPVPLPPPPPPPGPAAAAARGAPWQARLAGARRAVSADLAIHGLAYLGVLLLFAGVSGLVVFSLGDVRRELRPVAEAATPASLLLAGAYLRRRGSTVVGVALAALGGSLLPLVVLASLVDAVGVPPDPGDAARAPVLAAAMAVVATAYAVLARRGEGTPWRHLVAPVAWLAVAAGALGFVDPVPSGSDIGAPVPGQYAAVLVAVALSAVLVRLAPRPALARMVDAVVLPGAAVAEIVMLLGASRHGWPTAPLVVGGGALVVVAECERRWLAPAWRSAAQVVALVATVVPLATSASPATSGVVTVVLALALVERAGRRDGAAGAPAVTGARVALGALVVLAIAWSAPEAWSTLTTCAVLGAWAHARRLTRPPWSQGQVGTVAIACAAALAPLGAASGLARMLDTGPAAVALGASALAVAAVVARLRPDDRFLTTWAPAAAALAVAFAAAHPPGAYEARAAGAALGTVAIAVGTRRAVARIWATGAAAVVPLVLAGAAAGLAATTITAGLAVLGALAVAVAVAAGGTSTPGAHATLAGHLTTIAATAACAVATAAADADGVLGAHDQALPVALLAVVLGAAGTVALDVRRGSPAVAVVADALVRGGMPAVHAWEAARGAAPVLVAGAWPVAIGIATVRAGGPDATDPWTGTVAAAAALVPAGAAWVARRRPWASVLSWTSVLAALLATGRAAPGPGSAATAAGLALAVTVAARRPWAPARVWLGWAQSGLVAVLVARASGLAPEHLYLALGAWGAVVALGAAVADDRRNGRRRAGTFVRSAVLVPPVVLGGAAAATAQLVALSRPLTEAGRVDAAGALVAGAATIVFAVPLLGVVGWALASASVLSLASWDVRAHPWSIVVIAAVEVAAAALVHAATRHLDARHEPARSRRWDRRHDLPALVVATVLGAVAVALAPAAEQAPLTWSGAGAVALAGAIVWRRHEVAVAGLVLVDAGAAAAGASWATGAYAATSAALVTAAARTARDAVRERAALLCAAVATAAGAWVFLLRWAAWDRAEAVVATAIVGGAAALAVALAVRTLRLGLEWIAAWGVGGAAAVASAAVLSWTPDASRAPGWAVAGGLVGVALAAVLTAPSAPRAPLRDVAALMLAAAAGESGWAAHASAATVAGAGDGLGAAATAALLVQWRRRGTGPWVRPAWIFTGSVLAVANGAAASRLPDRPALVATLLVTGASLAATGLVTDRRRATQAGVGALVAAWIVFASDALAGTADWFTVPTGIGLLVMVELDRDARRRRGDVPVTAPATLLVEVLASTLVVAAALVEIVVRDGAYALVAVGGGVGLGVWGAATHVRRRLAFAAVAVVLAVVLVIGVPLADLFTRPGALRDTALWIVLAAVGAVAIAVAALLEEGRARVGRVVARLDALTRGWE